MRKWYSIAIVIAVITLAACSKQSTNEPGTTSAPAVQPTTSDSVQPTEQPASSPSASPNETAPASPNASSTPAPVVKSASYGFDQIAPFPYDVNSYSLNQIVYESDSEIIVASYDGNMKLVRYEVGSNVVSSKWEGTWSDFVSMYNAKSASSDDGSGRNITFQVDDKSASFFVKSNEAIDGEYVSPDGKWSVYTKDFDKRDGIWGKDRATGQTYHWTRGKADSDPLWFPDSTKFLYFADTGKEYSQPGYGNAVVLTEFDVATQKSKKLPFEEGLLGRSEWIIPGVSLTLINSANEEAWQTEIVNLQTKLDVTFFGALTGIVTRSYNFSTYLYNPVKHQILTSQLGHFQLYDEKGKLVSEVPWLKGYDSDSSPNPAFNGHNGEIEPYYKVGFEYGPHDFRISPDGNHIAYQSGFIVGSSEGGKLVISNADTTKPIMHTSEKLIINEIMWTPSSERVLVFFKKSEVGDPFIGWLHIDRAKY